jgi:antitoxin component YwqK of YwqJK toxin-antitoxin module
MDMSRGLAMFIVLGILAIAGLSFGFFWDAIPGTYYRDSNGLPHGTGRHTYRYRAGSVQLIEDYRRGRLTRSEWFMPGGASIMVTDWNGGTGVGIYLREDGTIRTRMTYSNEVANGPATYYAEDGKTVIGEATFKDGVRISGYDPRTGSE